MSDANMKQTQQQPLSQQQKLDEARAELAKWEKIAACPGLPPRAAAAARNIVRSSRAIVTLREKALAYHEPHSDPETERRLALYRLFRLPLPPVETERRTEGKGNGNTEWSLSRLWISVWHRRR